MDNSPLNMFDKVKAMANFASNAAKLADGAKKIASLPDLGKTGLIQFKDLVLNLVKYLEDADKVGKQACKANHVKLHEVFDHYGVGDKLTDAELEARNKEKKKAKRKAKKDRKKNADKKAE